MISWLMKLVNVTLLLFHYLYVLVCFHSLFHTFVIQEEEIRKRMEEASTERQKRIAERTAASKSKVAVSANSEAKKLSSPKVGPTNTAKGLGAPDRRNK